jgi:hypothetical protein
MFTIGDSIMDIEGANSRETTTEWAKLGLEHLQHSLGKSNISISDAVNAFMAAKDKASCTHIFVFTIMLMKAKAEEFDNSLGVPGLMDKWIEKLTERYKGLPESLDNA